MAKRASWAQVERAASFTEFYVSWDEWTGARVLRDNNRGIVTRNPANALAIVTYC